MSLREAFTADFKKIIDSDNDDVTLTKPAAGEVPAVIYSVKGIINRTDVTTDPQTGAKIFEPKTAVTVSLSDLSTDEPDDTWSISVKDVMGNTIAGKVIEPQFDRTLGRVTMFIEVTE